MIANRGEIAVRVIRACRELGIATVAVYSELDRDALHVRLADEAYALGGQTAAESYLNTEAILDVIDRSGADGVHPGYGFFSENTDFARAITDRGVAFIGPPPEAIEVMGDKISARARRRAGRRARACRAPPSSSPIADEVRGLRRASTAGRSPSRPRTAAAGAACGSCVGRRGGRGARVGAARGAKAYFGRDECYVERYLTWPRHVEMQIIGDTHGNCVWVGERDCSAQRRHQKLIEESPAPAFPDEVRQAMGEAAVKVAQAVRLRQRRHRRVPLPGRRVLLPRDEHPAPGRAPRHRDGDAASTWWPSRSGSRRASRCRSRQDDDRAARPRHRGPDQRREPGRRPLPAVARHDHQARAAPDGFGTRWDGGYEAGDEVSQYYDNLVGKLDRLGRRPRHGHRPDAPGPARRSEIEGVATTIPADVAILEPPRLRRRPRHSTKWVEETLDLSGVAGAGQPVAAGRRTARPPLVERDVDVEVNGKRFAVKLWVPESAPVAVGAGGGAAAAGGPHAGAAAGGGGAAAGRQRRGHRADAGHDREGARRGGRGGRGRPGRRACSRR